MNRDALNITMISNNPHPTKHAQCHTHGSEEIAIVSTLSIIVMLEVLRAAFDEGNIYGKILT